MKWARFLILASCLLSVQLASAFSKGRKVPDDARVLAVKFQVHLHRCTTCAQKIVKILEKEEGVLRAATVPGADAAIVFFESGRGDLAHMKHSVRMAGFEAEIAWGPMAANLDGSPEQFAPHEMPRTRLTYKEIQAERDKERALVLKENKRKILAGEYGWRRIKDRGTSKIQQAPQVVPQEESMIAKKAKEGPVVAEMPTEPPPPPTLNPFEELDRKTARMPASEPKQK